MPLCPCDAIMMRSQSNFFAASTISSYGVCDTEIPPSNGISAARAADIPFEGGISVSHTPYEEIVEAAKKFDCDLIMMASHGHKGINKLLLGSQTDKVLAHTTLPVLVLR